MTSEDLRNIIEMLQTVGADTTHIEAKRAENALPSRLWETISAFANTEAGGVIILGVDETAGFKPIGVKDPGKIQADIASLCDQMEPPLRPLIQVHPIENRHLVSVEIPEVPYTQKPCFYRGAGLQTGAFIRVADGDRRLTPYEIQAFLDARGQPQYDLEPVLTKTTDDLDRNSLTSFLNRLRGNPDAPYRNWDDARLLRTFRILTVHDDHLVATLAGYLCFGMYPQDEFPNLYLSVVRYPASRPGELGLGGERLLDNVKVEGPLPIVVARGLEAITRNLQRRIVVSGLLRTDVFEYPVEALREAVVNALAHRDYSPVARGTPVQVRLFPERLEVESPGGLFGPVTADRLGESGLIASRNAALMKILEDLPVPGEAGTVCENRGTGIVSMREALLKSGLQAPLFEDRRTTFRVTFSNARFLDASAQEWLGQFGDQELNNAQRVALVHLHRTGTLTESEYRRVNLADSPTAQQDLHNLTIKNILEQHGTGRWARYTLAPRWSRVGEPGSRRRPRADRRADILNALSGRGLMSRMELQEALGLKAPTVLRWLRILREEGKIEPTTHSERSPAAKYRLVGGTGDSVGRAQRKTRLGRSGKRTH